MSDDLEKNSKIALTADERLQQKNALWASIVSNVAFTSPPAIKAIIATRCVSVAGFVAMIPLRPEWYVFGIYACTFVALERRLAQLAERELRSKQNATEPGGAKKPRSTK